MALDNKANSTQVGGDHYRAEIQHWDYVTSNNIPYLESQVSRYVQRWRKKGGIQDLDKAAHFLQKVRENAVAEGFYDPKAEPAGGATPGYADQARDSVSPAREGMATSYPDPLTPKSTKDLDSAVHHVSALERLGFKVHIY